jgi:hypothetical protein
MNDRIWTSRDLIKTAISAVLVGLLVGIVIGYEVGHAPVKTEFRPLKG